MIKNKFLFYILLFFIFAFLASIFLNLPLLEINKKMPSHQDAYLVSWIWSWDIHALTTDPLNLFQANIFAPFEKTLTFSETMLGTAFLAWPILLISDNVILAFNMVSLLTFAISGLGMYLLVYYLTKNKWASFLGALIYAFAPYKLLHNGHLHLTGMWLPFVFLYLHKFFKNNSLKNILLLTLFIILVLLTGFHYFIFLPIVIAIFGITYISKNAFKLNKNNLIKISASLIMLLLITIPLVFPYWQTKEEYGLTRSSEIIESHSPVLIDYFISPIFYGFFNQIETFVSPGLVVILLLILSIYIIIKNKIIIKNNKKNLIIYSLTCLISFLISLGFYIRLTPASSFEIPGLFGVFYNWVPGFSGIRSPGRYSIFTLLSITVLVGYGISLWYEKIKSNFKKIILYFGIITFLLIEFAFVPTVISSPIKKNPAEQKLYSWVKKQPEDKIFLEMPIGFINDARMTNYDIAYVFNSRLHFRKIVNGYSGYYPPGYLQLAQALMTDFEPGKDLAELKKFQVDYLIFHFDRFNRRQDYKKETLKKIDNSDNFIFINNFGEDYVFKIIYD